MESKKKRIFRTLNAVLILITAVAGYMGFTSYYRDTSQTVDFWTRVYYSIQLFILQPPSLDEKIPFLLNFSRFFAPFVTAGTIINLLFSTFQNWINYLIINLFYRDHLVFCGLGIKSFRLIGDYLKEGKNRIIVIEKDPENLLLTDLVKGKIRFIIGNAEEVKILKKANIKHSSRIFCLTGSDKTNISITQNIIDQFGKQKNEKKIKIILHVSDYYNLRIFKDYQEQKIENIDFHAFNMYQKVAATVVDKYSPDRYIKMDENNPDACHILVHGLGQMGEYVVEEALQQYHFANLKKPRVTIVDIEIESKIPAFLAKFPLISHVADIDFKNSDDVLIGKLTDDLYDVDTCFICSETDSLALKTAKFYRQEFFNYNLGKPEFTALDEKSYNAMNSPRIVVLLPRDPDFFNLFRNIREQAEFMQIELVDFYSCFCNKKIIADDLELTDDIAMRIHKYYVTLPDAQLVETWNQLIDSGKDDNRYPARHMAIKLRYLGAEMVDKGKTGEEFDDTKITEEQKLTLSRMEHNRWMADRLLSGYVSTRILQDKDLQKILKKQLRLHKDIRPWEELSDTDKKKDSLLIDNLAKIVKEAGRKLIRLSD
jgi:voltage-gated potassium channel Kch